MIMYLNPYSSTILRMTWTVGVGGVFLEDDEEEE